MGGTQKWMVYNGRAKKKNMIWGYVWILRDFNWFHQEQIISPAKMILINQKWGCNEEK